MEPVTMAFHRPSTLQWQPSTVRGIPMDKAVVSEGDYNVRSAFFRMPAGLEIPFHFHPLWVQVMVVKGRLAVTDAAGATTIAEEGDCYFNAAGCRHIELALVDSVVLVTQGDDRNAGL